ncbi:isoprenylcysteine carboxylmethyltransferase family protein [Ideonella sp. DXS29W]|uniref:Isoprenylcysteine carboxylmethyltransferase family protein n=1 Tax=Ideonella lacteola TaxID=2984193 RepID=A0ABU9BIR0_9BURK
MLALSRWTGSGPWPADTGVAGAATVSAGLCLLVVARLQFALARTNIFTFDEPGQLVTSGAFRVSRHPMYLGFALALLGWALLLQSWPSLCVAGTFVLITDRWYIAFEERWLRAKFGQAYSAYAARTRRWV